MSYDLFVDSFDTATTINTSRWVLDGTTSNAAISAGNGRHSSASLRLGGASGTQVGIRNTAVPSSSNAVVGFSFKVANIFLINVSGDLLQWVSGVNTLVSVVVDYLGYIKVTLGGTTYSSVSTLISGVTYHIQIGVVIGTSGSLEVRVNGSSSGWLNLTGVNTKPGTDTGITAFRISHSAAGSGTPVDIDDFWLTYGTEQVWLGDVRIDALALTANATPQQWTPDTGTAYTRLNADAGYIESATVGDESLFELADFSGTTTDIKAVVVNASAKKTDAGSRSFAIEVNSGGTLSVGANKSLADTTAEYRQVWLTDPATSAAWTPTALNALQVGVKDVA